MKQVDVSEQEGRLIISWSRLGRLVQALWTVIGVAPLAFLGLAVFFAPDIFLGDIQSQEPVPGLFWVSLAGLGLLVGLLVGLFRFLRYQTWIVDGRRQRLIVEVKTMMGAPVTAEVELGELKALVVEERSGLRISALRLRLEGSEEVLYSGRGLANEVQEHSVAIKAFLDAQGCDVALLDEVPQGRTERIS